MGGGRLLSQYCKWDGGGGRRLLSQYCEWDGGGGGGCCLSTLSGMGGEEAAVSVL